MNVDEVVAAFRDEARNIAWAGEVLEALPLVTRRCRAGHDSNDVSAFALDEINADAAISEQVAHFGALGKSFEWKVFSFDSPPDILSRLKDAGFTIGDREALVFYDLADGLEPLEVKIDCEVRRVVSVDQLADFQMVAEEAFGKDNSFTVRQLAEALETGQTGHDGFIAYIGGEPASAGRLYTSPNSAFAGLYGGGTRPAYRGQGCYRALIAARGRFALEGGARYLQVDAMPTSQPILERLGFVHVADTWPCVLATTSVM